MRVGDVEKCQAHGKRSAGHRHAPTLLWTPPARGRVGANLDAEAVGKAGNLKPWQATLNLKRARRLGRRPAPEWKRHMFGRAQAQPRHTPPTLERIQNYQELREQVFDDEGKIVRINETPGGLGWSATTPDG